MQAEPYRVFTYQMPHLTCVMGLVSQLDPKLAIFDPGKACGMPYAPLGLPARGFHFDSRVQSRSMQLYCLVPMRLLTYARAPATVLG